MPDDFSPWSGMQSSDQAPVQPAPSTSGTKRDFGNMINEKPMVSKIKKQRRLGTHWELPQKMKLDGF